MAINPLGISVKSVETAKWHTPADVVKTFNKTDGVGGNKFIFNISRAFRLAACVWFKTQRVYVLKVTTHKEYDKEEWK